ncbi:MAG: hypothetical protein ACRDTA_06915 [Pseudonocardiaceae bacterium]
MRWSSGLRAQIGSGHGLLGMHERAAALTGTLHARPQGDGFEVTAELPAAGREP